MEEREHLKALILAGGFGTRLRPLSCTRPKLLFPIANEPLLDLTLQRLAANGVDEVILAVNFMADSLERHCGTSRLGVRLHYSQDVPPTSNSADSSHGALGTGGPVKQAQTLLKNEEPFLVLNGDILTEASYLEIVREHKKNHGVATLALYGIEDPSRYGVVELSEDNHITRFIEKPSKRTSSRLINAGIYVFEPELFQYIPVGKPCSLEKEIFPRLAEEGKLFGHEIKGLWIDVGEPGDYIRANKLWLNSERARARLARRSFGRQAKIAEAVAMDESVQVGEGSTIGPNVSLGKGVSIGNRVNIRNSIVLPYTSISRNALIMGSLIGESVTIGRDVQIGEGCLVGDGVVLKDGVKLTRNVKVCPFKVVSESILKTRNIT
jgi:mannose-1-phosphate guanylyltransferase